MAPFYLASIVSGSAASATITIFQSNITASLLSQQAAWGMDQKAPQRGIMPELLLSQSTGQPEVIEFDAKAGGKR